MKKPSAKIREEIGRLQQQLKQAETREAERIGRIALRAGLGEIEETALLAAFEDLAGRFRESEDQASGRKNAGGSRPAGTTPAVVEIGAAASGDSEA
ncbi:TraC family protein [Mesorhizobium sp. CGMCC 1.15528]|uniref:TraC family protein n=1 Tax=Mesorhizobium zhangyense TaxID=1776730 RepID=A0A7C9VBZ5_9HYPH|nr:conjugal transfer protein TraC [Mesorhizobium zhangyense]NGN43546.1 TraC family protein [Mesorhizobium zhangyense]